MHRKYNTEPYTLLNFNYVHWLVEEAPKADTKSV